jgi:hypothetical protein
MAAKTWDQDFRKDAIQASIRNLGPEYRDDPFLYDGSFCLPVGEKPVVGWTPGRFSLIALVVGFTLMGAGVAVISAAEQAVGQVSPVVLTLAGLCSLSGFAMFFIPVKGDKLILRWMLGDRVRARLHECDVRHVLSSELGQPGPKGRKLSIDGDDHVLIFFDDENHKIMIEGIGARYQIRARDVESLNAYQFMNYMGVEITCRIDENTTLDIALARVSLLYELLTQVPIFLFLKKRLKNPLLQKCEQTLQFSDAIDLEEHAVELAE